MPVTVKLTYLFYESLGNVLHFEYLHRYIEYLESEKFPSINEGEKPLSSTCSFTLAKVCQKFIKPPWDSALGGVISSVGCRVLASDLVSLLSIKINYKN